MWKQLKGVWAWLRTEEPVQLADSVRLLLVALVGTGWVFIPDARINAVASLVAVLASIVATKRVRSAVTPNAKLDR